MFHSTLARQMRKYGISENDVPDLESLQKFLQHVNNSYISADQDRDLLERSIQLSSTELQQMYEKVRESESRYELAINGAQDGIWEWDLVDDTCFYSSRWYELTGVDPNAENARTREAWFNVIHPDDRDSTRDAVEKHISDPCDTLNCEQRLLLPDGTIRWVLMRGLVCVDSSGCPRVIAGSLTDTSQRKIVELEVARAHGFLQSVVESLPGLIVVRDKELRILLANDTLRKVSGIEIPEMIGTDNYYFKGVEIGENNIRIRDRKILDGEIAEEHTELSYEDETGKTRYLAVTRRRFFTENDADPYLLAVGIDITERKEMAAQLGHAQKLESLGQLAAGIAHEINTPTQYVGDNTRFVNDSVQDLFAAIDAYEAFFTAAESDSLTKEILQKTAENVKMADVAYLRDELPNAISQTLEGVERIAKIVQSMKEFAHPDSRERKATDLNRAIESTITVARNEWKYVADMELKFDEALPPVPCYTGEFNQVILNMVVNAAHAIGDVVGDASRGKGKIVVTTKKVDDNWAEVSISDTGNGIPPNAQSKIFDPFFTTKPVGKGTGQGLAISHTVIKEKHGGEISFQTEQGKGTTFFIRLPF